LDDFYKNDLKGFIEYNLQDVRIVAALDAKLKMIDLAINIAHVGHTQLEDYSMSSKYIEGTILTYLHRQGRVVPNKRAEGRAEFEEKLNSGDEEGFAGAFVKPPMPGLYEWVYNLDLQSLYPSIIMSLNISPETKVGYVRNWNIEDHVKGDGNKYIVEIGSAQNVLTRAQFIEFMQSEGFMLSSNGVLYRSDKLGVIPEILDIWFNQRVEFKSLMKKYKKEGDDEQADYYDRRQHVQKILLNSIYGVLGLPIFRFYDLDNALAVTSTGQDVIKASAKCISQQYAKRGVPEKTPDYTAKYYDVLKLELKKPNNKLTKKDIVELLKPDDHCIYIDTDSVYFSALPLMQSGVDPKEATIELAREMEALLNRFYNPMAKKFFFCDKHRFVIKGEAVCETAFWVAKKRYAMKKIYDLESNMEFEKPKMGIKGLDAVRSSFPPAFAKFMSEALSSILDKKDKPVLDDMVLKFRSSMNGMPFKMVARNTSVSAVKKVDDKKERGFKNFPLGAAAHVKAAITYNRWLRANKLDKIHVVINDGDKIKYTYLKKNPLGMEAVALKGYDDPEELVKFVDTYIDYEALFEKELKNKLEDFYDAQNWGMLPTDVNQSASKFFSF
jgi:DNA polymerase elongation subunit (family B)